MHIEEITSEIPIRTYSLNHVTAGHIEFSVPLQSPIDVEIYLEHKLQKLPLVERITLETPRGRSASKSGGRKHERSLRASWRHR